MKIALWYKNQLISKAKTDVQKNTQDPVFGKTIYFDLPELDQGGLKNVKLDLAVMDKDWGKDDLIGRLVLGGENCVGSCLEHWNRLIECPLQDVEMWHQLCDLGAVTTKLAIKSESTECDLDKTLPSDQVNSLEIQLLLGKIIIIIINLLLYVSRLLIEACSFLCVTNQKTKI